MNVSSCRCYSCNTDYPTFTSLSSSNSDKQNLILQICNGIFKAIQNENTSAEIVCSMSHRQIRNINDVETCINEEFRQLLRNNVLRKEINSVYNTWRIRFRWSEFNNDSLIKNLLSISKKWYDPFTNYLQKINNQKRNKWFYEHNGEDGILDNLKQHLPGFNYLIEYSWRQAYFNNYYGDFVFASDTGIFIEVTVNARNGSRFQALENFEGKYITFLRATYNYDDDDDSNNATLEFIDDNDEIIMQSLKDIHNNNSLQRYNNNSSSSRIETYSLQRHDNNNNQIGTLLRDEQIEQIANVAAGAVVGIAAVAAVAGVGYLAYKAATNKTVRRTATAISYGYLAYSLIQELEREREREGNDDDD